MGSDACLCGLRGEPALIWWPRGSSRVHGGEGGASIGGRILYAVCAMQYACISVHTGTSNNSCPRSVLGRNLSVTPPSCSHLQVRTVPLNTHFEPAWEAQLARPKPDLRIAIWAGNFPTLLFTAFLYGISQVRRMNLGGGKHRERCNRPSLGSALAGGCGSCCGALSRCFSPFCAHWLSRRGARHILPYCPLLFAGMLAGRAATAAAHRGGHLMPAIYREAGRQLRAQGKAVLVGAPASMYRMYCTYCT